jgi:hypothetical protein
MCILKTVSLKEPRIVIADLAIEIIDAFPNLYFDATGIKSK